MAATAATRYVFRVRSEKKKKKDDDKDKAKPAEIQEKMMAGKINKILSEMCLTGQAYVIDTNMTVEAAAKKEGAEIVSGGPLGPQKFCAKDK